MLTTGVTSAALLPFWLCLFFLMRLLHFVPRTSFWPPSS
jgi:hypothetical protein